MKHSFAAVLLTCASCAATAGSFDIDSVQNLSQQQFHELAQDLGAALSYKPLEPADPLGVGGFDIGAVLTATPLANTNDVQRAISGGTIDSTLLVPTLRATLGLPYHLDFGAMYSRVPSSPINLWGADLKWAVLPGDIALPAIAVRASVTRLDGVSQLGFETIGADVSVSKGILNFTPYGGVGAVWSRTSTTTTSAVSGLPLQQENVTQPKVFVGCGINLGLADLTFEADSTGAIRSYSGKLGFRF
jgi:hypothetical protein